MHNLVVNNRRGLLGIIRTYAKLYMQIAITANYIKHRTENKGVKILKYSLRFPFSAIVYKNHYYPGISFGVLIP